ncbi:hypothetical protein DCO58_10310 [Helicobacter saguini]|uniref:RNA pseudouridylate synthase n=1 Tax=Helicobacter saguini TaxID=1548018 RepID=A0A4U8SXY4_9HELI|nr:RNA pseudouridine synthase [Helicobacter saguini]MWV61303.1 hypothetical protein [Helicobacter saguini]MWV68028.1 hypothetical protein [Helicobacter saguini]MWV70505.1 hypothetical protein [Helicobacter saguini]MWV72409.1 hypothetical protein [Helicobacter saguini]TLD91859.1 RNA pseudouridine synthase [Helicobacter saguini]
MKKIKFCVFRKPSNLLTHPKNLSSKPSLLDSIRHHFGKAANACHRLDKETSGLVLCSVDKKSEVFLKDLFSARAVHKEYLALVRGEICESLRIESSIFFSKEKQGNLCIKGSCESLSVEKLDSKNIIESKSLDSSKAITLLIPLEKITNLSNFIESTNIFSDIFKEDSKNLQNLDSIKDTNFITFLDYYNTQNITLEYQKFKNMILSKIESYNNEVCTFVKLIPLTGRTHQLRIHTSAINHAILGDTLYGVKPQVASFFLDIESEKVMKFVTLDSKNSFKFQKNIESNLQDSKILNKDSMLDSKDFRSIPQSLDSSKRFSKNPQVPKDSLKILDSKFSKKILKHSLTLCNIIFQNSQYFIESSFNFTSIFTQFIYFYLTFSTLKNKEFKQEIQHLMHLYYAKSVRLMLHSNRLKFLHYDIIDYKI